MVTLTNNSTRKVLATILTILFMGLSGCGGGGGAGGGTASTAITVANAEDIASATFSSVSLASGTSDLASGFVTGVVITGADTQINYIDFAKSQLDKFKLLQDAPATQGIVGVVISPPIVVPCDNQPNGTITITGDVADTSSLSTGDYISFDLDNCEISQGLILNGGFTIIINQVSGVNSSGDLVPPYSISITLSFSNLTDVNTAINGDITLAENSTDGINVTSSISGSSLAVSLGVQSVSISNFSFAITETLLTETGTFNGTVNISGYSGGITFETREPFVANIFDNYPHSGMMIVTGSGNSSVKIRAIDVFNVVLEIDADGDGITDANGTIQTTWTALDA